MRQLRALVLLLTPFAIALAQAKPGRILGVFDEASYAPIVGVEIVDLGTGTRALTTETGTISLAYLRPGTTVLQIRKLGYAAKMVPLMVSANDTSDVTIVLSALVTSLPTVTTTAKFPADTVRKLASSGFYDRMHAGGAPYSAFVTEEQLAKWKLTLLADIKSRTGREICKTNTFIDGVKVDVAGMAKGRTFRSGVDEILRPEQIVGIEVYTHANEFPAQFNITQARGTAGQAGCLTLIWTK